MAFIDSDDAFTKTALKELYDIAENFKADVVQCDRYYRINDNQTLKNTDTNSISPDSYLKSCKFVTEPTLLSFDKEKRFLEFQRRQLLWNVWGKLIRRDLISENELKMVGKGAEDMIFTACLLCCAEKYIRIPNVVYFYRETDNSITRKNYMVAETVHKWIRMLSDGVSYLEKFFSRQRIFSDNVAPKYILYEALTSNFMNYLIPIYAQIPAFQFDELLRKEFEGNALMAFLFSRMNVFNVQLNQYGAIIQQMNAHIQRQNQIIQQLQQQLKEK